MRIIRKRPGEPAEEIQIKDTLKALQEAVGGYIETVTVAENVCIICDDESRLKGKLYNCNLLGTDFVGTILVVGVSGDEFCDVPAEAWPLFGGKGKAPAGLAPEASAVVNNQVQDTAEEEESQMEDNRKKILYDAYDRIEKFCSAANTACEGKGSGTVTEFICPLCGGKAMAEISAYNGHHHARCSACGFAMME